MITRPVTLKLLPRRSASPEGPEPSLATPNTLYVVALALWLFPGMAMTAAGPAAIPVGPGGRLLRWSVSPWVGVSTVRLGKLDAFPKASINLWWEPTWLSLYSAPITDQQQYEIDWAIVEGLTVGYQVNPLVGLAVRVGYLRTEQGSFRTVAEGAVFRVVDSWTNQAELLMVMGGAVFKLAFTERTRVNVALFLGIGTADISIDHRQREEQTGSLLEAHADARGTAFIPEFSLNLERDLAPALAVGVGLGYRFGGVESFTYRHENRLNFLGATVESRGGDLVRDGSGDLLKADFGGLVFALTLTARL